MKDTDSDGDVLIANNDLATNCDLAAQWRVTFNAKKTVYMIISKKSRRSDDISLYLNGEKLRRTKSYCYLSLWLTETMSWEAHINYMISKTSRPLNVLKSLSSFFNRRVKLTLYKTYIRPILDCACVVFNTNLQKRQVDMLEDVQRRALLCSINAYRHASHQRLLTESGFDPLINRRKFLGLCHKYKIVNGLTPKYLADLLPPVVESPHDLFQVQPDYRLPPPPHTHTHTHTPHTPNCT